MESRTKNTKRNMVSGIVKQVVSMVLPFLIRTIVIYRLGTTYQGLTGLFSSILQVLNLTELGFSTGVMYILYKPIAENDTESICSIINYLKKVYTIVGTIILTAGMLIMPFLPRLISGDIPEDINIYLLFLPSSQQLHPLKHKHQQQFLQE